MDSLLRPSCVNVEWRRRRRRRRSDHCKSISSRGTRWWRWRWSWWQCMQRSMRWTLTNETSVFNRKHTRVERERDECWSNGWQCCDTRAFGLNICFNGCFFRMLLLQLSAWFNQLSATATRWWMELTVRWWWIIINYISQFQLYLSGRVMSRLSPFQGEIAHRQ